MSSIFTRAALAEHLSERRRVDPDLRVVLANGCFDVLHVGHVRYLEDAASRGTCLVVGLNDDESVRGLKGPTRPLVSIDERLELIAALRAVDAVFSFNEPTLEPSLRELAPDVHAKGPDYTPETVPERAIDLELGIEIAICGDPKDHSSTELIERISGSEPA